MKKVTLFIDKTLRDGLLSTNEEWSVAYRSALTFQARLIAQATDPRGKTDHDPEVRVPHEKYVCGCHAESGDVRRMFSEAHRIEVCLTLRHGSFAVLTMDVLAYKLGEKRSYSSFRFNFRQEDGSEAGPSSSQ